MEDGFFLRKKPLGSMDSVNTRIENAVAATYCGSWYSENWGKNDQEYPVFFK
jgi:hypothetical protein